jgi:O-antigen/teichoic acid export membrane protein
LKKLIDYINNNVLIKITSLQGASVITRIIAGILTSKAIAVFIGPTGLALIGNLQNFVSSFQTVAILGFYNGAVKYISDFKDNTLELSKTLSTLFTIITRTSLRFLLLYFLFML